MAVQGTGAMAMLIADVRAIGESGDPTRALVTLSILTGVVMLVAGLLRLGTILRFVSNAVMVGFINAVGVNIVLGQLANLTGYCGRGRQSRDPGVQHPDPPGTPRRSDAAGRRRDHRADRAARADAGSGRSAWWSPSSSPRRSVHVLGWDEVATLRRPGRRHRRTPHAPSCRCCASCRRLLVPAVSLAFVGLVQGAGISANFPNPDGSYPDASRDFVGQGVANVASGVFQGMPVGGSVSASSLNKEAGARSRWSLVVRRRR